MKSTYSHSLSLEALADGLRPLVRERPTVWLVGAGISHPSPTNLPLGHDFISGIIDAVQPNPGIGNRLKQLCGYDRESRRGTADYLRFEGVLSLLQQTIDPGLVILDCMREERIPNGYHYFLAKLIKGGHQVFTTNFDCLIERAFRSTFGSLALDGLSSEEQFASYDQDDSKYHLFKLHGSVMDGEHAQASIRATLSRLGLGGYAFELETNKKRVFRQALEERPLIICGYSGLDDYDIIPVIESTLSSQPIIWIEHTPEHSEFVHVNQFSVFDLDPNGGILHPHREMLYKLGGGRLQEMQDCLARRPTQEIRLVRGDTARILETLFAFELQSSCTECSRPVGRSYYEKWFRRCNGTGFHQAYLTARMLLRAGYYGEAKELLEQTTELPVGDSRLVVDAYRRLTEACYRRGEYEPALEYANRGIEIADRDQASDAKASMQSIECFVLAASGRKQQASKLADQLGWLPREDASRELETFLTALHARALLAEDASPTLQSALQIAADADLGLAVSRATGYLLAEALSLYLKGCACHTCAAAVGNDPRIQRVREAMLAGKQPAAEERDLADTRLEAAREMITSARMYFRKAVAISRTIGARWLEGLARLHFGSSCLSARHYLDALHQLAYARDIFFACGERGRWKRADEFAMRAADALINASYATPYDFAIFEPIPGLWDYSDFDTRVASGLDADNRVVAGQAAGEIASGALFAEISSEGPPLEEPCDSELGLALRFGQLFWLGKPGANSVYHTKRLINRLSEEYQVDELKILRAGCYVYLRVVDRSGDEVFATKPPCFPNYGVQSWLAGDLLRPFFPIYTMKVERVPL